MKYALLNYNKLKIKYSNKEIIFNEFDYQKNINKLDGF